MGNRKRDLRFPRIRYGNADLECQNLSKLFGPFAACIEKRRQQFDTVLFGGVGEAHKRVLRCCNRAIDVVDTPPAIVVNVRPVAESLTSMRAVVVGCTHYAPM